MQSNAKVKLARSVFPVVAELAYLDTASVGPVSSVYAEALMRCTAEDQRTGRARDFRYEKLEQARLRIRSELATLLGASPDELALTQGTTAAIRLLLSIFPWQAGDEIVSTQLEFPPCREALEDLVASGKVQLRIAEVPESDAETLEWLERCITPRTKLIVFSGAAFTSGQRLPVEAIASFASERGIQTLIDGAQIVGSTTLELDRMPVDFVALPVQKWLCGPEGLGALFIRSDTLDWQRQRRVTLGWPELEATAEHLEWLRTHLEWPWIFDRTMTLARYAMTQFSEAGNARLATPPDHAGLVSVRCEPEDYRRIVQGLAEANIVARQRPDLNLLRIATAFFVTEDEINRFAALVS